MKHNVYLLQDGAGANAAAAGEDVAVPEAGVGAAANGDAAAVGLLEHAGDATGLLPMVRMVSMWPCL